MTVPARTLVALAAALLACNDPGPGSSPGARTPDAAAPPATAVPAAPLDPEPGAALLTPDGWGPLRIGMSRAEVVAAAGEDANPEAVGGPEPEACDEFRPAGAPSGVLLMIESGVLTRISVSRNRDIATPAGLRVGDPAARVLEAYGAQARVDPHKYEAAPAQYITVWREPSAAAERRGLRYEIGADGNVAHLRAGGASIEYVEGCL